MTTFFVGAAIYLGFAYGLSYFSEKIADWYFDKMESQLARMAKMKEEDERI